MSEDRSEEQQVADFARHTRKRRIFFGAAALGVAALALVGAMFLFGGQLQTAEKARAGQAADELRRRFEVYREKCRALWRELHSIDWARIPEDRSRPLAARLAASDLSCDDVHALASGLPRRAGVALPGPNAIGPASAPGPRIRLSQGVYFGPPPASVPSRPAAPASAPLRPAAPAPAPPTP